MAITPQAISAAISGAGPDLLGPSSLMTIQAISQAIWQWMVVPANLALTGVTSGLTGSGYVIGAVTVIPNVPLVVGSMASSGVSGPTGISLARAVCIGLASAVTSSAQYQGASVGVGAGADVSFVTISNVATLVASLQATLSSFYGGGGPASPMVASGLGVGIASMMMSATGVGVVSGAVAALIPVVGSSPLNTVF